MPDNSDPQEIILIPVDENGRVLLFTDVKIETIDRDYRTIRDPNGLSWKIVPGDYTVKVFLRNLQIKSVPLKVETGVARYRLPVDTGAEASPAVEDSNPSDTSFKIETIGIAPPPPPVSHVAEVNPDSSHQSGVSQRSGAEETASERRASRDSGSQKRFSVSFPVSYRTDSGKWVKAKALNVSGTGICVENVGKVTEDDNLYVRLHVPVATVPIECPARVVWVTSKETGMPCMGLQLFLTANMRESLDRWLSGM